MRTADLFHTHTHTHARPRDRTVDLVKSIAIFSVLTVHASAPVLTGAETGGAPWLAGLLWSALSHAAVPLFLMASGALLLDPARELSLKKLYTRNFPRLLAALLAWAWGYKLVYLLGRRALHASALVQAGKEVLLFQHEGHLYYLHMMLLVYAFLPVTRLIARHAGRTLLAYLLGLWFLLGIIYPTVKPFWPFRSLTGIPAQWLMNMTYASIGYTLLGYALSHGAVPGGRRRLWLLTALAGFLTAFCGTWIASSAAGQTDTHWLEGMGLGMCLLAAGIWGLCRSVPIGERASRGLAFLSRASFCIFLSHIFFLKLFARLGLTALAGPPLLSVPLLALLLLACGCGVYWVLARIPGVRTWLICT